MKLLNRIIFVWYFLDLMDSLKSETHFAKLCFLKHLPLLSKEESNGRLGQLNCMWKISVLAHKYVLRGSRV